MNGTTQRRRFPGTNGKRIQPQCEVLETRLALSSLTLNGSMFSVTSNGSSPQIAKDSSGDYVVTYDDGNGNVYVQGYSSSNSTQFSAFAVTSGGDTPSVAMDANGHFIVAWHTTSGDNLDAQEFNFSDGSSVASAFQVNTTPSSYVTPVVLSVLRSPKVAMDPAGDFVFTWGRNNTLDLGVWGRLYNSQGQAVTGEFLVDDTNSDCGKPWVAMDSSGNFTISYGVGGESQQQIGEYDVYFQRYNSSGQAQGSKTFVAKSTDAQDSNRGPAIAMDSSGDFVITWADSLTEDAIYAQVFNSDGTAKTSIITVADFGANSNDGRAPYSPAVTMDASGDWVVTWSFGSLFDVYARGYSLDGTALSDAVQVSFQNPFNHSEHLYSSVAIDSSGDVTVVWVDTGSQNWGVSGAVNAQNLTLSTT
ncbi:MAG TPA: hypothetical protein VGZ22_11180 [Isosphaeraceae bacterium]|jgi:hypothetical protein|nr:hypothetical protein [Isosphaeraceae bacterium]